MWFLQVVHYPLYRKIKEGFVEYERAHIKRAAFLIGPIMLIEIITAIFLIGVSTEGTLTKLAGANLILLILIWLSTFLFQLGQHQKLSVRFSHKVLEGLIYSNWIRTILWTFKGLVMVSFCYHLFHLGTIARKFFNM
jgi:hypothetical protein